MRIYFARHGRSTYNDLGFCNSDPSVDVHLTSVGKEQARALQTKLKDIPIEKIFASELRRTKQTADIINEPHHVPVEVIPLLNDVRSGFEGQHYTLHLKALDESKDRWNAKFNDGESIEEMKKRVKLFLDQLKAMPYDTVLVVTSQWIIFSALAVIKHISNEEAWDSGVEPGSLLELEI